MIHFNPTMDNPIYILRKFLEEFTITGTIWGWEEDRNNVDEKCSYHAWVEIINFMLRNRNPFKERLEYHWRYNTTKQEFISPFHKKNKD